ncbi:DNA alkylation repair protein [Paenibacillus taichungensis]|uniref:DNA alkylation repair protein n=1 Tax=Paenibacillus taichungensis TaxID=484184 RepID=A0A329QU16_9BACL|nr:DNA alkylation repair protein [Paenibacillus taichungensis]RAW15940.1 DNA alkylation repair protein [Paenibacillus taichungensis]
MDVQKELHIPEDVLLRKGARKGIEIPDHVRNLLQSGHIESVNLTEWLAVDHVLLFQQVAHERGMDDDTREIAEQLARINEQRIMKIIPTIAANWLNLLEKMGDKERVRHFRSLAEHRSDSVRCWAAYIIGLDPCLSIIEKLDRIRPFAADHHFGVREIAWMAVRQPITAELSEALAYLMDWAIDPDPMIRRFSVESTRPHGVWSKHIQELKENPALALPLLNHVKSDAHKYVQDSVSNWLNDAAKTNPDWVRQVCDTWIEQSDTKQTLRIITRGQRSL